MIFSIKASTRDLTGDSSYPRISAIRNVEADVNNRRVQNIPQA